MKFKCWKDFFGPGLITGASDDDPSGIATYTQAGAMFGLGTLWTTLFTIPFMVAVQEASARLAIVTRKGLVKNLLTRVPRFVVAIGVLLFVAVCVFNLGADLGMMVASAQLFWPLPYWIWMVFFVLLTLLLQTLLDYRTYANVLKWLCLSLFAYVVVAFSIRVDWFAVITATFMPQIMFTKDYLTILVALLGTTISPYLYVWQSSQEIEEEKVEGCEHDHGKHSAACLDSNILFRRRADIGIGMGLSNLIAWFIVLTAATVLFANGLHDVKTPVEAAEVLAPVAGPYASWIFTIGVIGTGLLAVPILSSCGAYTVSELIGLKKYGLSFTWKQAPAFNAIIVLLTLAGAATTALGLNPIQALIYAAVGNAMIAPLLILAIIRLTNDRKLMGVQANGPISKVLLWGAFALMSGGLAIWLMFF